MNSDSNSTSNWQFSADVTDAASIADDATALLGDFIHESSCGCTFCASQDDSVDPELQESMGTGTGNGTEAGTLQELADYLSAGYWSDAGTIPRKYNLGSTGLNPKNGVLEYNISGFSDKMGVTDTNGISEDRAELVRESFKLFEEVLGIDFVETTSQDAEIFFSDNQSGAYASSTGFGEGLDQSLINVAASWSGGTATYDDYTLQTIMHEIGHALGLGHQGLYNGSGSYSGDADFANDSWQGSMMSYFSQSENTFVDGNYEFLQTPMSVDWLALQDIYGDDTFGTQNAFQGDTVYGFNTNISSAVSDIWANFASFANTTASTIIDSGGVDTLDVSGYTGDQRIDLTVTTASDFTPATMDIGNSSGNLTLAVGTVIENAIGGSGDDSFTGNAADNVFDGNGGDDVFFDSAGSDTYLGGLGTDTVEFFSDFVSYSFEKVGSYLQIVEDAFGAAIDFVEDTVEWLSFADVTLAFDDVIPVPDADPVAPTAVLEFGNVAVTQSDPNAWTYVSFSETIQDAVVTLGPASYNGSQAVAPRIRNVTDDGFEVNLQEYSYLDGTHVTETLSWVAASAGVHEVGGLRFEAGITTSAANENWTSESFATDFSDAPVVLAQALGESEMDALVTRIQNADADGFDFKLQEEEAKNGLHVAEDVHWIAFEQGNGDAFDATLTPDAVTQNDYTVSFDAVSSDTGVFLAAMQSQDGGDTANLRLRSFDDDRAVIAVQEERSRDSEVAHTTETVGFLTAEDGFWFA